MLMSFVKDACSITLATRRDNSSRTLKAEFMARVKNHGRADRYPTLKF